MDQGSSQITTCLIVFSWGALTLHARVSALCSAARRPWPMHRPSRLVPPPRAALLFCCACAALLACAAAAAGPAARECAANEAAGAGESGEGCGCASATRSAGGETQHPSPSPPAWLMRRGEPEASPVARWLPPRARARGASPRASQQGARWQQWRRRGGAAWEERPAVLCLRMSGPMPAPSRRSPAARPAARPSSAAAAPSF